MNNNQTLWNAEKVLYILASFLIIFLALWLMLPTWNQMNKAEETKKPAKIIDLNLPKVKRRSVTFRE